MEKQTWRIDLWTWERGGGDEMYGKSNIEIYITICKMIANGNLMYVSENSNRGSVST